MHTAGRPRSRPRVVHVTTADISLALLLGPQLRAFVAAGYDVVGVSAPGPYVAQLEHDGIEHRPVEAFTRSFAPGRDGRAFVDLYRLLRGLDADVVHTHNPKPGVFGRVAARCARTPAVVNTVHGLYATPDDPIAKRAVVYGLERIAAACSDAELVQNPEDLEQLARLRVPRHKLHLLGNGVDLGRFDPEGAASTRRDEIRRSLGVGPDDLLCGIVGRLVWEKGYREVFSAAARLRDELPSLHFAVVGPDDPEKDDAVGPADLDAARRSGRVQFLGARDDMEALYAAMDLYVLASYREGFPRSAMEAAAMGLPVIATQIRGCREVVDDGVTGALVPPRDASALTDAIRALALDPDRRRTMGEAAVVKARREFDQQRVIDVTLDVYERLLARRDPNGGA